MENLRMNNKSFDFQFNKMALVCVINLIYNDY